MKVHFLQHVPFEGLGSIDPWLRQAEAEVSCTKFFEDSKLPKLDDIDFVIVMGGPMSVNDEAAFEWLKAEKKFIRCAIEANKAVLGICLGAQLIANSLGKNVYPNSEKEIGWFPVTAVAGNDSSEHFNFPDQATVFHWHGETFDLPENAVLLASSPACVNQAFQLGRNVLGFQFHLETTPSNVAEMVANCGGELLPSRYVQSEEDILKASSSTYLSINSLMADALDWLVFRC
jgi:GMP synthase-like glutamine amidotransferase